MWRSLLQVMLIAALLAILPLLGTTVADRLAGAGPKPWPVGGGAHFSLGVFIGTAVVAVLTLAALLFLAYPRSRGAQPRGRAALPWWGWLSLTALLISWILAWSRFAWFAPLQPFTFVPLWFSYVFLINALAWRRSGHCMLTDRPALFIALFPASALFWWYFEYLNGFVHNWGYNSSAHISPWLARLHSTIAFSSVIPAVQGTTQWLGTFPWLRSGLVRPLRLQRARRYGSMGLIAGVAGLVLLPVWPQYLFALVWVAPLVMIVSLQAVLGEPTYFAPLRRGQWERVYLPALAALTCGALWEMWNYYSEVKWTYRIPYVGRFRVFEMPLLGYTGYLPFGLECVVIADLCARLLAQARRVAPALQRSVR